MDVRRFPRMHAASAGRRLAVMAVLMIAALLGACASLPSEVQRTPSVALSDVGSTTLARIARASTPADSAHLSGLRLLPDGHEALETRLALARHAQAALDVQYYQIASDATGLQFLGALRDAAARGVRVRLLVDDLNAIGQDELFSALAAHTNVEVRMFNPLAVRGGTLAWRVLLSLPEFGRVNRRMHNKLFIADNALAISGGRNIADEYFTRSPVAHFIDMDVLSSGPVVTELSTLFDTFWNSEAAFPIDTLAPATERATGERRFETMWRSTVAQPVAESRTGVAAQLERGRLELQFAPVSVVADAPDKARLAGAAPAPGAAMQNALQLLLSARSEVLIVSPYFVPGPRGVGMMRDAIDAGVRVAVMTNSFAATDEPMAHWAYMRYRLDMLRMGVSLSELSPVPHAHGEARERRGASVGRLHAKLAVVDRRWLLVGSMNMDPRSSRINTEFGLVIDNAALAEEATATLQRQWRHSHYRLRVSTRPETAVEWVATGGDAEPVQSSEPHADWLFRVRLGLLSMFVGEEQL